MFVLVLTPFLTLPWGTPLCSSGVELLAQGLGIRRRELLLQLHPSEMTSGSGQQTTGLSSSSATSRNPVVALGSEIWEEDPVGVVVPVDVR